MAGWPYLLEHKHPGEWKEECLKRFEGGLWTHSDGKTATTLNKPVSTLLPRRVARALRVASLGARDS
jgi:hypothetical protein